MKKIFKKNQIIITALALMIAVAGYLQTRKTIVMRLRQMRREVRRKQERRKEPRRLPKRMGMRRLRKKAAPKRQRRPMQKASSWPKEKERETGLKIQGKQY